MRKRLRGCHAVEEPGQFRPAAPALPVHHQQVVGPTTEVGLDLVVMAMVAIEPPLLLTEWTPDAVDPLP